ncbi:MAG: hypothetical protein JO340_00925 [Acidobacteriaceae bacterium]|nr:hypothetical protein [Acidobacteriaceae bacterium]
MILLAALPLASWGSEFNWLVREFARQTGVEPVHIPLFGLVQFVVAVARPAGTSELKLAVFEHVHLEPARFTEMSDNAAGNLWKPMIRVKSSHHESTNIYAQTEGERLRLLIATLDQQDATFVQVRLKPEELMRFLDEHGVTKKQK